MISHRRAHGSGNLVLSALVSDGYTAWLRERIYIGYNTAEAKTLYRKELEVEGLTLSR
jgi:hypothetical protein